MTTTARWRTLTGVVPARVAPAPVGRGAAGGARPQAVQPQRAAREHQQLAARVHRRRARRRHELHGGWHASCTRPRNLRLSIYLHNAKPRPATRRHCGCTCVVRDERGGHARGQLGRPVAVVAAESAVARELVQAEVLTAHRQRWPVREVRISLHQHIFLS